MYKILHQLSQPGIELFLDSDNDIVAFERDSEEGTAYFAKYRYEPGCPNYWSREDILLDFVGKPITYEEAEKLVRSAYNETTDNLK